MAQAPELIDSATTCQRLNIDRSTLSRWVSSGRIEPAMKLGGVRGAFLFDPREVDRVKASVAA